MRPPAPLALLALLLGFSFSLGASAYENRRHVILNETLVIEKAHKRVDLLPEPTRSEAREFLIQYIDTRLDLFYQSAFQEHVVRARLRESRRNVAMPVVLSILFGFLIAIVIDLDQPRHGIIRASQRALTNLQETLRPVP